MIGTFTASLFETPSVQRFMEGIVRDLGNRQSILVILHFGVEPRDLWNNLVKRLWVKDFRCQEVILDKKSQDQDPIIQISRSLRLEWPSPTHPRTISNMLALDGLPDIIYLEGLNDLDRSAVAGWISLIELWATASHRSADSGELHPAIVAIVSASSLPSQIPASDIYFALHWWWGFPSLLETHLLCRLANGNEEWDHSSRWREHLLSSISSGDVRVLDFLWPDFIELDIVEISRRLVAFSEKNGWEKDLLKEWGAEDFLFPNGSDRFFPKVRPPERWHDLWAHGVLRATPEHGMELHSAALVALGREGEFRHRMWRGQAELLLPSIDHIRLTICKHLTKEYGDDWPYRWIRPESKEEDREIRENSLACEWGHLIWLLDKCRPLSKERFLLSLAVRARWLRNEIAHYRPVRFHDYKTLLCQAEEVIQIIGNT